MNLKYFLIVRFLKFTCVENVLPAPRHANKHAQLVQCPHCRGRASNCPKRMHQNKRPHLQQSAPSRSVLFVRQKFERPGLLDPNGVGECLPKLIIVLTRAQNEANLIGECFIQVIRVIYR